MAVKIWRWFQMAAFAPAPKEKVWITVSFRCSDKCNDMWSSWFFFFFHSGHSTQQRLRAKDLKGKLYYCSLLIFIMLQRLASGFLVFFIPLQFLIHLFLSLFFFRFATHVRSVCFVFKSVCWAIKLCSNLRVCVSGKTMIKRNEYTYGIKNRW